MSESVKAATATGPRVISLARDRRVQLAIVGIVLLALLTLPAWAPGRYVVTVATTTLVYLVLVLGLNAMMGYAGILNLGYAAFAGLGAYVAALLMLRLDWSIWVAMPVAATVSTLAGLAFAIPTLRLKRVYLGIVTLAFGEIFVLVALNLRDVTGGGIGLAGIPRPTFLGIDLTTTGTFYYFVLGVALLGLAFIYRISSSRFGRAWEYVREDEIAAESTGTDVRRTKLFAYGIGSAYAGVGGVLLAEQLTALNPSVFDFSLTLVVLTMVVVGGTGSIPGAIVGTLLFTILPEVLRELRDARLFFYGAALALVTLVRPEGLVPPRRRRAFGGLEDVATAYTPSSHEADVADGALLEAESITKVFGGLVAVDHVSLDVMPGEVVSIIGPNGAGKTTLVDILTGVTAPTSGRVRYRGADVTGRRASQRAADGMARTFQKVRLFDDLTVLENVLAGTQTRYASPPLAALLRTRRDQALDRQAAAASAYWLRFVGQDLFERRDDLIKSLPYGIRKRVEIARALAAEPSLLLLDEPVAGLNTGEKLVVARLISDIRATGVTVVLIEHDMRMVMSISDRVVVLDEGGVIARGAPGTIQSDRRVIDAYLGEEEDAA